MEKVDLKFQGSMKRIENLEIALLIYRSTDETPSFYLGGVELKGTDGCWQIAEGVNGRQFVTSLGAVNASSCEIHATAGGGWEIRSTGSAADWEAEEAITIPPVGSTIRREQTYRFLRTCEAAVCPSLLLRHHDEIRYTYPL